MADCTATTAKGKPCKGTAMPGTELCASHIKGKVGRKTTLDDEVAKRLVTSLSAGNYLNTALVAAGIPQSTYYDWMERGDPEGRDDENQPYREFRERIEGARARGEVRNVTTIATAAAKDWRAAAWLLEREDPERWARSAVKDRSGDGGAAAAATTGSAGDSDADPFASDPNDELTQARARRRRSA